MNSSSNQKGARIIALVNQKGGVGKTTTTINLGAALAQKKRKVLLIDLDPQANLTCSLGINLDALKTSIYEILKGEINPKETIIKKNEYDIIPATKSLSGAEISLSSIAGREFLLKEALVSIQNDYDYILLDCPPSLGLLTLNALTTASEIFITLQSEFLALNGVRQLLDTVNVIKTRLNSNLKITGIIATLYDHRKNLNKEVIKKIKEHFPDKLFKSFIRDNVALAEAPSHGEDIFNYKPESHGAADYLALSKEVIKQEEK